MCDESPQGIDLMSPHSQGPSLMLSRNEIVNSHFMALEYSPSRNLQVDDLNQGTSYSEASLYPCTDVVQV